MSITHCYYFHRYETSEVWISGIYSEEKYVESESKATWTLSQMRMQTLMKRKKSMEIAQIIDDALYDYYVVERGEDVLTGDTLKIKIGG